MPKYFIEKGILHNIYLHAKVNHKHGLRAFHTYIHADSRIEDSQNSMSVTC